MVILAKGRGGRGDEKDFQASEGLSLKKNKTLFELL